jgi:hypothetical protein
VASSKIDNQVTTLATSSSAEMLADSLARTRVNKWSGYFDEKFLLIFEMSTEAGAKLENPFSQGWGAES